MSQKQVSPALDSVHQQMQAAASYIDLETSTLNLLKHTSEW
ncbi:hypothetical protein HNR44_000077 [Geomicrobium halophilum]|uniref:Uncharacterized protein n=1 Tax=Geomicrobium halophilum TaxID=549000 RepID=A0A841PZJ9_9BACL|nr:hypothetical protein [Geomicrobium halophilum]MBB6448128.1 hypothetical protein [Geomicrobium halophilum]